MKKNKNYPKLICLIGIDGSGKTTVAKELVKKLKTNGINYKYAWVNNQPLLMYFIRFFWRIRLKSKGIKEYSKYKKEKSSLAQKKLIKKIYELVHSFDYVLWVWLKVKLPLLLGKKIIVDRYYFDVAINFVLIDNYNDEKLLNKIKEYERWIPKPDVLFYINISEETAFSRKDDIPDIEYLYERKKIYTRLAKKFNMIEINGENSVNQVATEIINNIQLSEKISDN
jgi:dTMP kinase